MHWNFVERTIFMLPGVWVLGACIGLIVLVGITLYRRWEERP